MENINKKKPVLIKFIINFILNASVVFYFIAFGSFGAFNHHVEATQLSSGWLITNLLKYILGIFVVTGWLNFFSNHRIKSTGMAVQSWLVILFIGWILQIITVFFKISYYPPSFFNQTLIFIRNGFPFLTGVILFFFIQPYIENHLKNPSFNFILFLICFVPLIADRDPFNFSDGFTLTAILIYGLISEIVNQQKPKISTKFVILTIALGYIFVVAYAKLNLMRAFEINRVNRWLSPLSPLTIIPAMFLLGLLKKMVLLSEKDLQKDSLDKSRKIWQYFSYSFLTAILLMYGDKYNQVVKHITDFIRLHSGFLSTGPFWMIICTFFLTLLIFGISMIAFFIITRIKKCHSLDKLLPCKILGEIRFFQENYKKIISSFFQRNYHNIVAICLLFLTQISSTLLMFRTFKTVDSLSHTDNNIFAATLFNNFPKMFVGLIVLVAFYVCLKTITNRYWFSLIFTVTATITFSIANRVKIISRAEPIIPADLNELKSISSLVEMIGMSKVIYALIALILILFLIVFLEHHSDYSCNWRRRLVGFTISGIFLLSLGCLNHSFSPTRDFFQALGVYPKESTNLLLSAQTYGPVLQYIGGLDVKVMTKPKDYSENKIKKIMYKYNKRAKSINDNRKNNIKSQTIIFNLSESFSNPTNIPGLKINRDPIPNIKKIESETTSGKMMSFGYGGGTANMEYMTLTGMSIGNFDSTLQVPYTQLVTQEKEATNVGDYFDYVSSIHPYQGSFYNRQAVYKKFGFDKFSFLGSKYPILNQIRIGKSPYLSDKTAYMNAKNQINNKKGGQFINLVSIQNHLPYSDDVYPDHDFEVSGQGFNGQNKTSLNHYIQGLNYTDKAVIEFKESIDAIKKPIIWVFYGDHLASLYNSEDQQKMHETEYFIYANKFARANGAKSKLTVNSSYTSASDFIALAFKQANVKVDAFLALLTDVQEQLPTQWISNNGQGDNGKIFIDEKGRKLNLSQLTKKQKKIFEEYQLIQYDLTAGEQYSIKK